jgi:hypothetical protein
MSSLPPSVSQCEGAVDSLASFHAFWWENPRLGQDLGARYSEAILADLLSQAQGNLGAWLDFMGDRVSPGRRATFERICGAWPAWRVQRLLAGRGITLVNRDTHAANFLYPRYPERDRARTGFARIVDWQNWRVDAGTDDLAYMIAAHWYPERRVRLEKLLLQRYQQRLHEHGIPYTWEECWQDYKASVIRVLFFLISSWQRGDSDSPRSPALWFDRVERATLSYEDLGCAWLLA